jgi:hypothetical protein
MCQDSRHCVAEIFLIPRSSFTIYYTVSLYILNSSTVKGAAHRTLPSAAVCGQKSVLLYIAPSVANRKWPDAAASGRPLVSISVLYLKTVCPHSLFKMDTEKLIGQVRNNVFLYDVGHNDYKNTAKKAEAWRDIAKEVNQDGTYYFFVNYFIFAHYLLLKYIAK